VQIVSCCCAEILDRYRPDAVLAGERGGTGRFVRLRAPVIEPSAWAGGSRITSGDAKKKKRSFTVDAYTECAIRIMRCSLHHKPVFNLSNGLEQLRVTMARKPMMGVSLFFRGPISADAMRFCRHARCRRRAQRPGEYCAFLSGRTNPESSIFTKSCAKRIALTECLRATVQPRV